MNSRAVSLSHGAPHLAQQPRSEVPALMHGSTSAGGKVAKCASLYGAVAIFHTERLLREPPYSPTTVPTSDCDWPSKAPQARKLSFGAILRAIPARACDDSA